ncbi:3-oxo-5-alpha-steroid 4-dehydrogenase domain containing protein [Elaphomyces granulatus]
MAIEAITLRIYPRGKPIRKLPGDIRIAPNALAHELYDALSRKSGYSVHRLRITKGSNGSLIPNGSETISDTGLRNESVIHVKDLGPQIGWRTVFIIEYLGPLITPALFLYVLRPYIYFNFDKPLPEPSYLQVLTAILLTLHFVKRELETVFVHRFSSATMPARNIIKNSAHYWILAGLNIAYWVFRPDPSAVMQEPNPFFLYAGLALFVGGELGNLNTHLVLRDLRRPGSTERGIPRGIGFGLVTCPNYMFEVISWLGIYLVTGLNWSVLLFTVVGVVQMMSWAKKKENRYRKEFGERYKPKRYFMLPGIF